MLFDNLFLDELSSRARQSERLRMHYDLRDSEDDQSMRMLNALEPGTVVPVHRHLETSEDIICIRGVVEVLLYDDSGTVINSYRLSPLSGLLHCHIPAGQYHASRSLQSGSVITEFKNGKYDPETTEDLL